MEGVECFEPIRGDDERSSLFLDPMPRKTGTHRPYGILILAGPSIRRGVDLEGAAIQDLTPTVLYLLGLPIPGDMDGRVLRQAVRRDLLLALPIRRGDDTGSRGEDSSFTKEEEEIVKERLRGLGYID